MFSDFKTTFPQVTIFSLNQIPVPDINNDLWLKLNGLVSEILILKSSNHFADTSIQKGEIDQIVYQLYDLTQEEIKIVEEETQ